MENADRDLELTLDAKAEAKDESAQTEPLAPVTPPIKVQDLIEYRGATAEDVHFIKKTWMRTHRQAITNMCPSELFFPKMEHRIGRIAERAECVIAADKEQSFYIYGWLVGSPLVSGELLIHYVYVRDQWRNQGVATGMGRHLGYTHKGGIIATHIPKLMNYRRFDKLKVTLDEFILEEMLLVKPDESE